jgi:hypothetical protein
MDSAPWRVRESGAALEVAVHVHTRARRSEIVGFHNGALKLKIPAPPVDNAANRAIMDFFSDLLNIARSRIRIVSGAKSRDKVLSIEDLSLEAFQSRLRETHPHLK